MPPKKRKAKAPPKSKKGGANKVTDEPAPKKVKFDFFNFTTNETDPIVENLREVSLKYKQNKSLGIEILDQISLEGLTGLTFGHLCRLLDASIPNLNCIKDDKAQDYIWSIIVNCYMRRLTGASVRAYHLEQANIARTSPVKQPASQRSTSQSQSQSQSQQHSQDSELSGKSQLIIDKEIKLPSHTLKRIAKTDWMLHPVQDGPIMGSCANYLSRVNVTQEILDLFEASNPRKSLHDLNRKYRLDNIYLVADQELRRKMLLPPSYDPNMDIKLREYACLELIGRTRCLGIVFPNDKSLGRYRILLTAKRLITQFQQTCNSYIVHHIRRFSQYNLEFEGKPFKHNNLPSFIQKPPHTSVRDDDDEAEVSLEGCMTSVRETCCDPLRLKIDCDMLRMVYDVIALSKGRSMLDIRRKLGIPKSHARNHLKNLVNIGLIGSHTRSVDDKLTRIYRAKHKSNKRKLARKKILKGVRSKWDEIDIRARELLGHRRSHFSQAEDSLLILCRITCLLMEPKLNKLSFCVPKQVIRDTLHDELFESHDKTSDSLLRRTKFLRHLPVNKMLINELTAELRDDADIVRLTATRQETESNEKLCKLFKQLLRAVRAKLPHLLGLTSSLVTNSNRTISIKSRADLKEKFELVDCQMPADGVSQDGTSALLARAASKLSVATVATVSAFSGSSPAAKLTTRRGTAKSTTGAGRTASGVFSSSPHYQPSSALIQLAQPISDEVQLELVACKGMKSILNLTSFCATTSFTLSLELKVPVRVVGLDQENESFKEIFERAKESKETSRIIADLTTPNPTADSRRALFMLRNALKLQTLEKCGKLADALIVRPCDIRFSSNETVVFTGKHLVDKFAGILASENKALTASSGDQTTSIRRTRRRGKAAAVQPEPVASTSLACDELDGPNQAGAAPQPTRANLTLARKSVLKSISLLLSWISVYPGIELGVLKVKTLRQIAEAAEDGERRLLALLNLMEQLELISSERLRLGDGNEVGCIQEPRLFGYSKRAVAQLATSCATSRSPSGKRNQKTTTESRDILDAANGDGGTLDDYHNAQLVITYEPQANAYVKYCQLINMET